MFEVNKIQTGLYGLVGIRQPFDPSMPTLSVANTTSNSGLYIDEIPPFNIGLLKETQDFAGITDNQFNTLLERMQKTSIANLMYKVFDKGGYIDRNYLFTQTSVRKNIETTISNGSVIGYEIEVSDKKNLGFKITNCRCEFDFDGGSIATTIYLMNSFLEEPLFTKQVTLTRKDQLVSLNWVVDSTLNDYKGSYYLLIKSDNPALRLQPFKRDYEDANLMNDISELDIDRVKFTTFSITDFLADENSNVLEISENVGLNPDITVFEDYTDMILQNQFLFARALQLEYAINALMLIATSTRSNRSERLSKDIVNMILANVNGTTPESGMQIKGYKSNLYYEIKNLKAEVEKLKLNYFGGEIMVDTIC